MHFGDRIRLQREELELTRKELAQKLSIPYHTLAKYETNINEPNFDMLVRIANALDVSTDYLLGVPARNDTTEITPSEKNLIQSYRGLYGAAQERIKNHIDFEFKQQKKIITEL
ncbi:MAG: helix-turn-helix transcriptional regulator [Schwartzia succinivorans]|nr:helix-turn-helix transcriptional regulator [Schwartzia succinivorans]